MKKLVTGLLVFTLLVLALVVFASLGSATITFNEYQCDIYAGYFYDDSAGTYTNLGADGHDDDYFPDNAVVGDAYLIAVSRSEFSKYNNISFDVTTALVATSITVQWEYVVRTDSSYVPVWTPLTNVVDGTNAFQNTGVNYVTFDIPYDWSNYINPGTGKWYAWNVRCVITSVTGLTEGGKQSSAPIQVTGPCFYVSNYAVDNPFTMDDVYDYAVLNGITEIEKLGNHYFLNCSLVTSSSSGHFETKQETIEFGRNYDCWFNDGVFAGEIVSGNKCRYGSTFIFNLYNGDLGGKLCDYGSEIYNSRYVHIDHPDSNVSQGHWAGNFGSDGYQTVYDTFLEGMRHVAFSHTSNALIGVKVANAHLEGTGAIIQDCTMYGNNQAVRVARYDSGEYIHQCDLSGATAYAVNGYQVHRTEDYEFDMVDCYWGTFAKDRYVYWSYSSSYDYYDPVVYETYSVLGQCVDYDNSTVSGASVTLQDKDGEVVFEGITNLDGYFGVDYGNVSSATISTLVDSTKSWTVGEWWFQEVYITSGTGVGQRRIIKPSNTGTSISVAPNWVTTPDITSKYIIIPYVRVANLVPLSNSSASYTDYITNNPYTLKINHSDYIDYNMTFVLDSPMDTIINLGGNDMEVTLGIGAEAMLFIFWLVISVFLYKTPRNYQLVPALIGLTQMILVGAIFAGGYFPGIIEYWLLIALALLILGFHKTYKGFRE